MDRRFRVESKLWNSLTEKETCRMKRNGASLPPSSTEIGTAFQRVNIKGGKSN